MSATRWVHIDAYCEDCGEKEQFTERSFHEAEKNGRRQGWFLKGEKALCPKHKQIQKAFRERAHAPLTGT